MLWRMRVRVMQPTGTWGVTYNWNMVRARFTLLNPGSRPHVNLCLCKLS
jgi:hypothetical protein